MDKTLFVSNLDHTVTKPSLTMLFQPYGSIELCNLYADRDGRCRGFAYITFENQSSFKMAMNSTIYYKGRLLRLEPYIDNNQGLQMKDEELSRLRVCVLGVPKDLSNQDFQQIFTNIFGEIEHAYIKQNADKKKNLGFVTFKNDIQNQEALRMRKIKISKSETLSLKKFTARKTHKMGYHEIFQKNRQSKFDNISNYVSENYTTHINVVNQGNYHYESLTQQYSSEQHSKNQRDQRDQIQLLEQVNPLNYSSQQGISPTHSNQMQDFRDKKIEWHKRNLRNQQSPQDFNNFEPQQRKQQNSYHFQKQHPQQPESRIHLRNRNICDIPNDKMDSSQQFGEIDYNNDYFNHYHNGLPATAKNRLKYQNSNNQSTTDSIGTRRLQSSNFVSRNTDNDSPPEQIDQSQYTNKSNSGNARNRHHLLFKMKGGAKNTQSLMGNAAISQTFTEHSPNKGMQSTQSTQRQNYHPQKSLFEEDSSNTPPNHSENLQNRQFRLSQNNTKMNFKKLKNSSLKAQSRSKFLMSLNPDCQPILSINRKITRISQKYMNHNRVNLKYSKVTNAYNELNLKRNKSMIDNLSQRTQNNSAKPKYENTHSYLFIKPTTE